MIDYEVLRFIWWLLIGILLIGFAVADGFDMGVGMLTRFLGRNDTERRIMINAIAPHWDGNQVWLITAGGALFAAWPMVYAAAFSGFYVAMILVLASLFFRPVGFDYRSKIEDTRWRNRAEFPVGREAARQLLERKWARELDYRLIKELWAFMRQRKKFWLLPILLVMVSLGGLLVMAQGSALAPFIYTLF